MMSKSQKEKEKLDGINSGTTFPFIQQHTNKTGQINKQKLRNINFIYKNMMQYHPIYCRPESHSLFNTYLDFDVYFLLLRSMDICWLLYMNVL